MTDQATILELRDVKTHFPIEKGWIFPKVVGFVKAVDGVSLKIGAGEILGLVGESGCGKSTLGRSILQLIRPTSGEVLWKGKPIQQLEGKPLKDLRKEMQMIFQDPFASLNPRMTVYDILAEAIETHFQVSSQELEARVGGVMEKVGLAKRFIRKYPHEFSGGQRQRIAIARALAVEPELVVADEPVSALDVSIQSQILNLIAGLCRDMGLTLIFISHDLGVVRHLCDRIAVMYLGKVVEMGKADGVYEAPVHPYSRALLSAVPVPDPRTERNRRRILLEGDLPSPINPPSGCAFHPRCSFRKPECEAGDPGLKESTPERWSRCIRVGEI